MADKISRAISSREAQLRALGIEPSYIGAPSERTSPAESYIGELQEPTDFSSRMEKQWREQREQFREDYPTPVHKFMGALGLGLDIADPGPGVVKATAKTAPKLGMMMLGGVPRRSLEMLGGLARRTVATPTTAREATLKAIEALKKGTTPWSDIRKRFLKDVEPGMTLSKDMPPDVKKAVGLYTKDRPEIEAARGTQWGELVEARDELKRMHEWYKRHRSTVRAAEIKKELDWLNKHLKGQVTKGAREEARYAASLTSGRPRGSLVVVGDLMPSTAFHEFMHSAQTAGRKGTSSFSSSAERGIAEEVGALEAIEALPGVPTSQFNKGLADVMQRRGYSKDWTTRLTEQEAWFLESMARATPVGLPGASMTPQGAVFDIYGDTIITAKQAQKMMKKLGLTEGFFGSLR